ncbi:MAG: alkaline phosphatase [Cytophagales bacterium]|nr:alkaline phosphatase [Cytophagales bacterium]
MKLRSSALIVLMGMLAFQVSNAQQKFNYPGKKKQPQVKQGAVTDTFTSTNYHEVKEISSKRKRKRAKNVILMIADGTGSSQFFAAIAANRNRAYLEEMEYVGFSKTRSDDNFVTDSAAGATALSTGEKSYNGAIGVDTDKRPVKTVLEIAEEKGLATGLISTSKITHATPAAFIAHQPNRNNYEEIAADFLNTDIDVFIGGGRDNFNKRKDGRDLLKNLKENGYQLANTLEELEAIETGKVASLLSEGHMPAYGKRGEMLRPATEKAVELLSKNKKGFFLMVEGSQVDWGGHGNNTKMIVEEVLDFDHALGAALEFAAKDRNTLVVVTADHETGGFSLNGGDMKTGKIEGRYTTTHHTGVMVPVFAFGPGADQFSGIYENTEIFRKIMKSLRLKKQ